MRGPRVRARLPRPAAVRTPAVAAIVAQKDAPWPGVDRGCCRCGFGALMKLTVPQEGTERVGPPAAAAWRRRSGELIVLVERRGRKRREEAVDKGDDDGAVFRIGTTLNDHMIAVVNSRLDHRVPFDFQSVMLAGSDKIGWYLDCIGFVP